MYILISIIHVSSVASMCKFDFALRMPLSKREIYTIIIRRRPMILYLWCKHEGAKQILNRLVMHITITYPHTIEIANSFKSIFNVA